MLLNPAWLVSTVCQYYDSCRRGPRTRRLILHLSSLLSYTDIDAAELPRSLCQILQTPISLCQCCRAPIFTSAFPMVFEGQIRVYTLCRCVCAAHHDVWNWPHCLWIYLCSTQIPWVWALQWHWWSENGIFFKPVAQQYILMHGAMHEERMCMGWVPSWDLSKWFSCCIAKHHRLNQDSGSTKNNWSHNLL